MANDAFKISLDFLKMISKLLTPQFLTMHCKISRNSWFNASRYQVIIANENRLVWDLVKVYGFYKDLLSILAYPSGPAKMNQLVRDKNFISEIANKKSGFAKPYSTFFTKNMQILA